MLCSSGFSMSLGHPSDVRSSEPDLGIARTREANVASLIDERGTDLLEALGQRVGAAHEHADATASYAFAAAVGLALDRDRCDAIRQAAKLHDVGKLYLPSDVLSRLAGELQPEDRSLLERQFEWAYRLALGAGIPDPACEWIRWTGERFDGAGPGGLAGNAIPLESRVIRAACACDLLLAAPTATQIPAFERRRLAIGTLRAKAGAELDPGVVEALATVLLRAAGG
jgi:response regulator RpfG family c-di-GMP phosphodiesterase